IIYFIQSVTEVIVIRILSQHQDAGKHVNWL
ncbi:TPA: type II toxin-antitoxin system RelE/ParE family toxin, partial [Salmonella enterica subsp. enterica serovar Waycross]